jgi:hypothetical protein
MLWHAVVALKVIVSLAVNNHHLGILVNDCAVSQHTRMILDFLQTSSEKEQMPLVQTIAKPL